LSSTSQSSLVGTTLDGRYEITDRAGAGGMSDVYFGRHLLMERKVAIKVLKVQVEANDENFLRFKQEAKALGLLAHPNIVTVFDFGISQDGLPYLVMDHLVGQTLADVVDDTGPVPYQRLVPILLQCCDAIAYAHEQGLIHRDLKPSNIMLLKSNSDVDFVKILDFGIAKCVGSQKLTKTGEVFGSPYYMSPEQCLSRELDARSDIYSLGCLAYEALTGIPPLTGDSVLETMNKHLQEVPPAMTEVNPDVKLPFALQISILRTLEKDPAARHQSMDELKDELIACVPDAANKVAPGALRPRSPSQQNQTLSEPKVPDCPGGQSSPKAVPATTKSHAIFDWRNAAIALSLIIVVGILWRVWAISQGHPHAPALAPGASPAALEQKSDFDATTVILPAPSTDYSESKNGTALKELIAKAEPQVRDMITKANAFFDAGKEVEAQKIYESVLTMWAIDRDHYHEGEYLVHQRLGRIYCDRGQLTAAKQSCQRAVDVAYASFGRDDLQSAIALEWLGYVTARGGDFGTAEVALKRSLEIRIAAHGHPRLIADTLMRLGITCVAAKQTDEAKKYFEQARQIWKQGEMPDSLILNRSLSDLGTIYLNEGKYDQAVDVLGESKKMFERQGIADGAYYKNAMSVLEKAQAQLSKQPGAATTPKPETAND
jgi:serine/threonine protein kinase